MLPQTCLVALLLASAQAFSFQRNIRHIPVEVRYEHPSENSLKNLEERLQLSADDLNEKPVRNDEDAVVLAKANLGEKTQLSQEELAEVYKHVPQEEETLQKLGEKSVIASNRVQLLEEARQVITRGLKELRENFKPKNGEAVPDPALWEKLDKDICEYFETERKRLELKQDQGGSQTSFFQTIANGIQSVTNNVMQGFQGQGVANSTNQGDEQQPGGVAGFIGYFQGGVQNILNQFNQNQLPVGGNGTVLGDTGTPQQQQGPGGFITGIFSGVQQIFQGGSQASNQANGTQGDTGATTPQGGQGGFFAGAINQFNQVVGTFTGQQSTPKPPNAQGDESSNSSGSAGSAGPQNPIQVIQSIGNNIGNAFNQLVQGGQQINRPQGSEDENQNQNPPQNQNFLQQIGTNIGNAFQNIQNNLRPPTAAPAVEGANGGSGGSGSDPIGQISGTVQNVGNQFQQLVGQQPGANPIESIQAAIPGAGGSGSGSKNPSEDKPEGKPAEESQRNNEPEKPAQETQEAPNESSTEKLEETEEQATKESSTEKLEEKKEEATTNEATTDSVKREEIMMAQE